MEYVPTQTVPDIALSDCMHIRHPSLNTLRESIPFNMYCTYSIDPDSQLLAEVLKFYFALFTSVKK